MKSVNRLSFLILIHVLFCSSLSFAQGAAATAGSGGNVCAGGGTGKCQKMCSDMTAALKEQCLQPILKEFTDLMAQNQIKTAPSKDGSGSQNWCPNESSADAKAVAVGLVAGVAIGESDCSATVPGPSAGTNGEKPVGYCQLNQSSVQPYPCCSGVTQQLLASDGHTEAKCGMGEVLKNVVKDKVWADGVTGKDGKGAAAFNQSCDNTKPNLRKKAEGSVVDACRNGGPGGTGSGNAIPES